MDHYRKQVQSKIKEGVAAVSERGSEGKLPDAGIFRNFALLTTFATKFVLLGLLLI